MTNEDFQLARMLLDERIHEHKLWWKEARADRLAELLDGVADAAVPVTRLLGNPAEEVQGDPIVAFDVAGLLLENAEIVRCALSGGAKQ